MIKQSFSDDKLQSLVDVIYNKVLSQIRTELNDANIEFCCTGTVVSVDTTNNKATVDIGFCTTESIPNLSDKPLNGNDVVRVFYDKYDMRNAYIGLKLN